MDATETSIDVSKLAINQIALNVKEQGNANYWGSWKSIEDEWKQRIIHGSTNALQPIVKNQNAPKYSVLAMSK